MKKKGVVSSAAVKVKVCAADGDLTDNTVCGSCGLNKERKKERRQGSCHPYSVGMKETQYSFWG